LTQLPKRSSTFVAIIQAASRSSVAVTFGWLVSAGRESGTVGRSASQLNVY
jgi:hypothetical protein